MHSGPANVFVIKTRERKGYREGGGEERKKEREREAVSLYRQQINIRELMMKVDNSTSLCNHIYIRYISNLIALVMG